MIELSCLCGQATVRVAERPDYINACNCTLCAKTGARWGYFTPEEIEIDGATRGYSRSDKSDPNAEVHFCETCGATIHFVLTESAIARFGNTMAGVNMLLADEADLTGVELRYPDGRAWPGAGDFSYVRAAEIIGG